MQEWLERIAQTAYDGGLRACDWEAIQRLYELTDAETDAVCEWLSAHER